MASMASISSSSSTTITLGENNSQDNFERTVNEAIAGLISSDPFLNHLPKDVTTEELQDVVALEQGKSMAIFVKRADLEVYKVIVNQMATVADLKRAIKRHYCLTRRRGAAEERSQKQVKISWKYIWKSFWLTFEGNKLTEDGVKVRDYGVTNNSEITFIKRLRRK